MPSQSFNHSITSLLELQLTTDGSHTIAIPSKGITYHSKHGAINESMHVFIEAGLNYRLAENDKKEFRIFEMGFGTGLNALLTYMEAEKNNLHVHYTSVEQFPLENEMADKLNYCEALCHPDLNDMFTEMHHCAWNVDVVLSPFFIIHKKKTSLLDLSLPGLYDIIYYDAFDPNAQPELWTQDVFRKIFDATAPGGILTTYCSKGNVRRAMLSAGFSVSKIPGPPHKREMLRAEK